MIIAYIFIGTLVYIGYCIVIGKHTTGRDDFENSLYAILYAIIWPVSIPVTLIMVVGQLIIKAARTWRR